VSVTLADALGLTAATPLVKVRKYAPATGVIAPIGCPIAAAYSGSEYIGPP
jgi:hypothetical protein